MLDAAREALSFVGDKSRSELDANRMLTLSLVKSIEIVGEAASRVSSAFRETHTEIPWMVIVTMRNRLIHAYQENNGSRRSTVVGTFRPLEWRKSLKVRGRTFGKLKNM